MDLCESKLELDMKQLTSSKLGKEYARLYIITLLNFYAEYITQNARVDVSQAGIKIAGEISTTSDM